MLVVEDDRLVRAGLKHELESLGYRVLIAASPDQAVEVFGEHADSIDLLLTDIVMPGRDGAELAKELRLRKPELALLFMSAFSAEVLVEQERLAPGHVTLEKPFSTGELASKVRAVLDGAPRP